MELFEQILDKHCLELKTELLALFRDTIDSASYQTLQKIKEIVADESLDDPACFEKIEAIITALESIGMDGGARHDFG